MSRTIGSQGERTLTAIRRAGIRRMYDHGFEAMSLRQLAADVGIQAGSLYNHIRSKQDFLYDVIRTVMADLLVELDQRLAGADSPSAALEAFVALHIDFHSARKEEVFIGNSELRSLSKRHYDEIVAMRNAYEDSLQRILEWGNREREWSVANPRVTVFALIPMLSGICAWYTPSGRLPKKTVIRLYTDLIRNGLKAK